MSQVHVVDPDPVRRNRIARTILTSHHHAEIYEDFDEFFTHGPRKGLMLAAQDVGTELWPALSEGNCAMPFAMYGLKPRPADVAVAIRAGAIDFLVWPFINSEFGPTLDRLLDEASARQRAIAQIQDARQRVANLTAREIEVLQKLTHGNSNKETAEELGLSPRTVEIHRAHAMEKVGARSAADAVRIAICAGLDDQLKVSW